MTRLLNVRNLLVVAMLVLAGVLIFVISSRYTRIQSSTVAPQSDNADLSLENIDYTETQDGKAVWRLKAADARHDLSSQVTRLTKVDLIFYGKGETGNLTLTAENGVWNAESGEIEVSNQVVATSENGYRFTSDRVHYKESDRLLWTDDPVRLVSDQMEVKGTGMRLLINERKLQLLSKVWFRWQPRAQVEDRG